MRGKLSDKIKQIDVYKIGGFLSGDPEGLVKIIHEIVGTVPAGHFPVIYVSAIKNEEVAEMAGIYNPGSVKSLTDLLVDSDKIIDSISGSTKLKSERFKGILTQLHHRIMDELGIKEDIILIPTDEKVSASEYQTKRISLEEAISSKVSRITTSVVRRYEATFTPQQLDSLYGEGDFLATMIISALYNKKLRELRTGQKDLPINLSRPVTAREVGFVSDNSYLDANIIEEATLKFMPGAFYRKFLKRGVTPFIAGFRAITFDGNKKYETTIGRNGTDTSSTWGMAMLYELSKKYGFDVPLTLTFLKDTDGCLSGDPKYIGNAMTVRYMSYRSADEAGNIHNKALAPLVSRDLRIIVRDYGDPEYKERGTFTEIGPPRGENKIDMVNNPKKAYLLGIERVEDSPGKLGVITSLIGEFGVNIIDVYGAPRDPSFTLEEIAQKQLDMLRGEITKNGAQDKTKYFSSIQKKLAQEGFNISLWAVQQVHNYLTENSKLDFNFENYLGCICDELQLIGYKPAGYKKAYYISVIGDIGDKQEREFFKLIGQYDPLAKGGVITHANRLSTVLPRTDEPTIKRIANEIHDKLILPYHQKSNQLSFQF